MLSIEIRDDDTIKFGDRFVLSLQRTLRLPDDDQTYPLPPGLGAFPIKRVEAFADKLPAHWVEKGGVFVPLYQFEALWLSFEAVKYKPNAVQVFVGGVNAVDGGGSAELNSSPQNYLVSPPQLWLDGINAKDGSVRQFIAIPLGKGYSVEGQVTGVENVGGIQIKVFDPKPNLFPNQPAKHEMVEDIDSMEGLESFAPNQQMGIGAGGKMTQKIYPDPFGIETWDRNNFGELNIFIVNSNQYQSITGQMPPETPISPQFYSLFGLPWFTLFDKELATIAESKKLAQVQSVQAKAAETGEYIPDEASLAVDELNVIQLNEDMIK